MSFGQMVIGPPGSGKTTYTGGMGAFLDAIGRKTAIVNLDPANDSMQYQSAINIEDLITLDDAMSELNLGPNGGMMYCIEYLEKNIEWLDKQLEPLIKDGYYFIFDCPGQVELYTHNESIKRIIRHLEKKHDMRLACVHLVDASYCTEASKFISVLLLSLTTMTMLELPHVNVLSKIDLLEQYGELDFNLEYYTSVMDLSYLLFHLNENETGNKFASLNEAICELIEDFNLVGFNTLCITDKQSVANLLKEIDKANGFIFGALTEGNENILMTADATDLLTEARDAQMKYKVLSGNKVASNRDNPKINSKIESLEIFEH